MATVQNEAGETFVVSDNSWSCSNAAQDGWATGGFTGKIRYVSIIGASFWYDR